MPRAKRRTRPPTTFGEQLLQIDRHKRRAARREARSAATPKPAPSAAQHPLMPDLDLLTISDRQAVTAAIGLDMPAPTGAWGPQPDARLSAQLRERFLADLARYEARQRYERAAQLDAQLGTFDARTADVAGVRDALAQLGITGGEHALQLHEVGRPLEPPRAEVGQHSVDLDAEKDREVARALARAMELGIAFDARKMTPGQLRELLALRST